MCTKKIIVKNIQVLFLDFDGVLTNNLVHLDQNGKELASCSRADGLAFDVLRKLEIPVFIISTERNPVVSARANKLNVKVIQGVFNKVDAVRNIVNQYKFDINKTLYVGNDLNDYYVMRFCGFSLCPADSHPKIKDISDITLKTSGGNGVVRELLEDVLSVDFIKILYNVNS